MNQVASTLHKAKQIIHASVFNVNALELQTPARSACTSFQVPSASSFPACGNGCHAYCRLWLLTPGSRRASCSQHSQDTFNLLHSYLFSNFFIRKTSWSKPAWFQLINIRKHSYQGKTSVFFTDVPGVGIGSRFIHHHVILHYKRLLCFYCKCIL